MDIAAFTGAYQGLKAVKEVLNAAFDAKVDAAAKAQVQEALDRLGHAQETMYSLRDELLGLQEDNRAIREQLKDAKDWQNKADQYGLSATAGGAVVYKFSGLPEHYVCPSCFNSKKEIHILQTNRTLSGKYRCTGCGSEFPIEQQKSVTPISVRRFP